MFAFLDFMRWGVGIGGWQIGRDTAVFTEKKTDVRFSPLICYESVYPGFVASFVRKGAELITLITIDSWWGRMSGAFQHQQYAVLRAVENRRWIARCAVGGISCYIDPYGRAEDKTELFTRAALSRTLDVTDEMTFYTMHGDWLGKLMLAGAVCTLAAAAVQRILRRKERHGREGY
jgi:apolipoprotein N-acyltransferase